MMWPSELMEKIADSILINLNRDLAASNKTHSEIKKELVEIISLAILDNNFVLRDK